MSYLLAILFGLSTATSTPMVFSASAPTPKPVSTPKPTVGHGGIINVVKRVGFSPQIIVNSDKFI
jgi:hypothetical protein